MAEVELKTIGKRSAKVHTAVQDVATNGAEGGYDNQAMHLSTEDVQIDKESKLPDDDTKPSSKDHDVNAEVKVKLADHDDANHNSDDDEPPNKCIQTVEKTQKKLGVFWENHGKTIKRIIYAICIIGYFVYFGYAMSYEFGSESSIRLLWMTCLAVFCVFYSIISDRWGEIISEKVIDPPVRFIKSHWMMFKWGFIVAVIVGILTYIIADIAVTRPENLLSITGYVIYICIFFVFSNNPSKVRWRPVLWGLGLQFVFALLVLRTTWGFATVEWLGERVSEFMEYADAGSEFVFGPDYADHFFAFKVMPVVIYFSTVISILYYLGIMQIVILKIAWVMQSTMGTTAAESVNAAGNIFIGMSEAPLLIRPLLDRMTRSELHAVIVGGFATIAGSVLATYILFGVPANHLITASVMAAPCALAMSKLAYPEEETTAQTSEDIRNMERPPYHNAIEAASAGASIAISLVANVVANLIAFIALLEFVNTTLTWMGHRVGLWPPKQQLTFQLICSYVLWPFAYVMGVNIDDCRQVAELVGVKVFINEFVAYTELGILIDNTDTFSEYNGTWVQINDDIYLEDTNTTLIGGVMEDRSIVIATYALCGFANISSIGMVIGSLGAMCPEKTGIISQLALRAMICGTAVSFMNACVAGLLYQPGL